MIFFKINNNIIEWCQVNENMYMDIDVECCGLDEFLTICKYNTNDILVAKNVEKKMKVLEKMKNFTHEYYEELISDELIIFSQQILDHLKIRELLNPQQLSIIQSKIPFISGYPGTGKKFLQKYYNVPIISSHTPMLVQNYYINQHVANFINFCVIGNGSVISYNSGNRPLICKSDCSSMLPFSFHKVYTKNDIKVCENMVLYDPYLIEAMFYVTGNLVIIANMNLPKSVFKYAKVLG